MARVRAHDQRADDPRGGERDHGPDVEKGRSADEPHLEKEAHGGENSEKGHARPRQPSGA